MLQANRIYDTVLYQKIRSNEIGWIRKFLMIQKYAYIWGCDLE